MDTRIPQWWLSLPRHTRRDLLDIKVKGGGRRVAAIISRHGLLHRAPPAAVHHFLSRLPLLRKAWRNVVKNDLGMAHETARSMGLHVTVSRDRRGGLSSCYVSKPPDKRTIRISDHNLPVTPERGAYCSIYADIYASPSPIRRPEWWKRAITLALAGRKVPGGQDRYSFRRYLLS